MKNDSEQFFRELKQDLITYAGLKAELLKLSAYERTGKVISVLSYGFILLIFVFFFILFVFIAFGFFLSSWFHSAGTGFALVAILYLLFVGGIILFKDRIRTLIMNAVISALTANNNNNKHDETESKPATNAADETVGR
jgi:hypothetical protein